MRETPPPIEIKLPAVSLYLDDVEAIEATLAAAGLPFKAGAGRYQLDAASELFDLKAKIHEHSIAALDVEVYDYPRSVRIRVDSAVSIRATPATPEMRGIAEQLRVQLEPRARWSARALNWLRPKVKYMALIGILFVGVNLPSRDLWIPFVAYILVDLALWAVAVTLKSTIVLERRSVHVPFFIRHREHLLVNALLVILTAVVTALATRYLGGSLG